MRHPRRLLLFALALATVLAHDRPPATVRACSYYANLELSSEALETDGVAIVTAQTYDEVSDRVTVSIRRWIGSPLDVPATVPFDVPGWVCHGPNSLKPGNDYLVLFDYEMPKNKVHYGHAAPWWAYEIQDGVLAEVRWEGSGHGRTALAGLTLDQAIARIQPYRDLLRAIELPASPAHEWDARTLRLAPQTSGALTGGLVKALSAGNRIAIGRVVDSTPAVTEQGPRTRQNIAVERWLFRPPDRAVTSFAVMQRGIGWGRWTLLDPSDSLMHPGERYLLFWRGGDGDRPELRFRIEGSVLRTASTGWFNLQVAEIFSGLTEDEAVARIQDCLTVTPTPRPGGRPTVTDHCAE